MPIAMTIDQPKSKPKIFSIVWKSIKNGFNAIIIARQRKANIIIADMLQRTEYRNESLYTVLKAIENNDLGSLNKNVK